MFYFLDTEIIRDCKVLSLLNYFKLFLPLHIAEKYLNRMSDGSAPPDSKDPQSIWQAFGSVFKNLLVAKGPDTEKYFSSISQMVTSIPQIIVDTPSWPDSREELSSRRDAFTTCLVRRVIHVVASKGLKEEPGGSFNLMQVLLSVMNDRSPSRW